MLIVVGGTLAASFIGFQARYVIQALKDIGALVKKETVNKISEIRFYRKGKKIGVHELFWDNGNKKMIAYFKNGEHNGEMTQWHKNGKVYKKFNYKSGFEEGNQKIWNDKGNLKANYDVIQGRRYGLTGIKNCKSVNNVY